MDITGIAKVFANRYARDGVHVEAGTLYQDGAVYHVSQHPDTVKITRKHMLETFQGSVVDEARSDDGMFTSFVLVRGGWWPTVNAIKSGLEIDLSIELHGRTGWIRLSEEREIPILEAAQKLGWTPPVEV